MYDAYIYVHRRHLQLKKVIMISTKSWCLVFPPRLRRTNNPKDNKLIDTMLYPAFLLAQYPKMLHSKRITFSFLNLLQCCIFKNIAYFWQDSHGWATVLHTSTCIREPSQVKVGSFTCVSRSCYFLSAQSAFNFCFISQTGSIMAQS